jgi:AcrR family transcriptional regulator
MSGLRERKKEAARLALHEAAFRLMSEQGPENVTVEAIAEAAQMSRRTFSNYFSSKEDALFYRENLRTQQLLELVRERPAQESALTALREALIAFTGQSKPDADRLLQSRLLRRRPSLTAYRAASHLTAEQGLTSELGKRLDEGPQGRLSAQMLAAGGLSAWRVATTFWLENQDRQLPDLVAEALDHLRE